MNKKLTQKQNLFLQYILEGKTQAEAYTLSYPNSATWTHEAVKSRASALFNTPHIQNKYQELLQQQQQQIIESSAYTKEQAITELLYVKQQALQAIDDVGYDSKASNSVIKSIQEISKLLGFYPAQQQQLDVSVEDKTLSMPDLSHLSYEELVDLIDRLENK